MKILQSLNIGYIKRISLVVLLFFSGFSLWAQEINSSYMEQMEKVFQTLNTNEPFSMKMTYHEIDKSGVSHLVSSCEYYKKGDYGRFVFEEYDNMVNEDYYIKADHLKKEMIVIKRTSENRGDIGDGQALAQFNPEYLVDNGYLIDSTLSSLQEGLLVFKSTKNPYYHKIELEYSPNDYPLSYTLYFRPELQQDLKSYQIRFENIQFQELEKNILNEKAFFTIKGEEIIPAKKYQSYRIINL